MLKLSNTLTGKKDPLVVDSNKKVTMYVCGITPYDFSHLGHGRCYVTFDVLYRLLTMSGYEVTYCRNFTDIDDKLINKAEKELGDRLQYQVIADRYIAAYHEDMTQLNCLLPSVEPKVTEHIPEIIAFIESLIEQEYAYQVGSDVYFHIARFPEYGKLSKRSVDDLYAGARVEINEKKLNPLDFALWKGEDEGTFWKSPWGWGRPGWHIECSALASKYLGKQIDIHGGGMDLIFPHHENEIAQSESRFHVQFVHIWAHNGFINVNKEKMSKSLGNFFTLRDIFKEVDPQVIRFYYLNHHYRSPLEFSLDDVRSIQKSYQRLCNIFASVPVKSYSFEELAAFDPVSRMLDFLYDDMNTVGMMGVLFESLSACEQDMALASAVKYLLTAVLGLSLVAVAQKKMQLTPEMEQLLTAREAARQAKDWITADALRDQLKRLGYDVQDKKSQ